MRQILTLIALLFVPLPAIAQTPTASIDPAKDKRMVNIRGEDGSWEYISKFPNIPFYSKPFAETCGTHIIGAYGSQSVTCVKKNPVTARRKLCLKVMNSKAAAARCSQLCKTNPACPLSSLSTPAVHMAWGCGQRNPKAIKAKGDFLFCRADFQCDCTAPDVSN